MNDIVSKMIRILAHHDIIGRTNSGNPIYITYLCGSQKVRICLGSRNVFYSINSLALKRWFYRNKKYLFI